MVICVTKTQTIRNNIKPSGNQSRAKETHFPGLAPKGHLTTNHQSIGNLFHILVPQLVTFQIQTIKSKDKNKAAKQSAKT